MDRCESNYSQRGHDWRWLNCRDGSCGYEGCPTLLNCGWQPREDIRGKSLSIMNASSLRNTSGPGRSGWALRYML